MTPEQKKAKEIVLKYANLPTDFIYIDGEGDRCVGSGLMTFNSAKACAIEEVKAVIEELPDLVYGHFEDAPHQKIAVDNPRTMYWKQLLTEIEKL